METLHYSGTRTLAALMNLRERVGKELYFAPAAILSSLSPREREDFGKYQQATPSIHYVLERFIEEGLVQRVIWTTATDPREIGTKGCQTRSVYRINPRKLNQVSKKLSKKL